tara:strand:+ start:359 stop:1654 length:1296 start_codon:yes stop_codon:yes gene_type:complete
MIILRYSSKNFLYLLDKKINSRFRENTTNIQKKVKKIILDVKRRGDKALFEYAKKFDDSNINSTNIKLTKKLSNLKKEKIDTKTIKAFKLSIKNVENFHKKQKPTNYKINKNGVKVGAIWNPIDSVGLYIPGGNSTYPSSLIMNVIPAKVAGVKRIVVVTPAKKNIINPYILALLEILQIKEVYQIGGAHAIAALAYGTNSIQPVNKIFGPGNAYVTNAKKEVFGKVGIDLIAGPSEIVVVADKNNNPKWVASDLIAQAEHDEKAQSILITDSLTFANKVVFYINDFILKLPKKNMIKKSLDSQGIIIINKNLKEASKIIDFIAPEHLHLHNKKRHEIFNQVNNAGCIFIGEYSSEAFGDYIVGTNHILPTYGSAKFSSGLGVLDFMKRSSFVEMNSLGYKINQEKVSKMAEVEQLEGHKLSVKIRQSEQK